MVAERKSESHAQAVATQFPRRERGKKRSKRKFVFAVARRVFARQAFGIARADFDADAVRNGKRPRLDNVNAADIYVKAKSVVFGVGDEVELNLCPQRRAYGQRDKEGRDR